LSATTVTAAWHKEFARSAHASSSLLELNAFAFDLSAFGQRKGGGEAKGEEKLALQFAALLEVVENPAFSCGQVGKGRIRDR
jgi:hypothetical protein